MDYFDLNAISSFVLTLGCLLLLLIVLLWHRQRSDKDTSLWFSAGLLGVLLGSALTYCLLQAGGKIVVEQERAVENAAALEGEEERPGGNESGGGMGGGGGGRGGFGAPNPVRDMMTLIRELELLTGDIGIALSTEQSAAMIDLLADLETGEVASESVQEKYDALMELLDDDQKSQLEGISLPRNFSRGGPGGGTESGVEIPDNPFAMPSSQDALDGLRARFGSEGEPSEPTDTEEDVSSSVDLPDES